ncbi:MAG: roadblock/LC7 domain-containing protein [Promethearchaeati archaeon SRVP18_Atabeyarchaeia-1]
MSDVKAFDRVLTNVMKSEAGIKKVILVDKTGLTIAHVSKYSYQPVDMDGIGAIASAVFCASEEQGKSLEIGDLRIVTSEFDSGKIFAASCGKGVLCVITDGEINIGMIRLVLKKSTDELQKVLDEFLESRTAAPTARKSEEEELKAALSELEKVP